MKRELRTALALAQHVGMRTKKYDSGQKPFAMWHKRTLAYHEEDSGHAVLHDVAHFLIAPTSRRYWTNFGLGKADGEHLIEADSLVIRKGAQLLVEDDYAQKEEELASLLGIALELHLGLDWLDTLIGHTWLHREVGYRQKLSNLFEVLYRCFILEKKGLLKNGRPTILDGFSHGKKQRETSPSMAIRS